MGQAPRMAISSLYINRWSAAMPQPNDLSRSLVALDQNSTIIAVVEMSQSSWLVGATSQSRLGTRSRGLRLPSKPAATAFGWRAGLRRVASRRT